MRTTPLSVAGGVKTGENRRFEIGFSSAHWIEMKNRHGEAAVWFWDSIGLFFGSILILHSIAPAFDENRFSMMKETVEDR